MASTNLSKEAGVKSSATMPIATSSECHGTGDTEAMLLIEVDSDDPDNMNFDTLSIYPATNYSSMHNKPYDFESMYARNIFQTPLKFNQIQSWAFSSRISTRSLYEKELDYTMENGRRYTGQYFAPNDEIEQDRLHITHQTHLALFNNQLTTIPLENPSRILDIGTGNDTFSIHYRLIDSTLFEVVLNQ